MKAFVRWLGRRQIALDFGSQRIKLLLTETVGACPRVLQHRVIDRLEEGLLSDEEVRRELAAALQTFGAHPIALAVPQTLAISQVIDLPAVPEAEVPKVIEGETLSLSGLSEGQVLYNYAKLRPFSRVQNPCWLTLSREESVQELVARLPVPEQDVKAITTTGNALLTAYLALDQPGPTAVLVDLGAEHTVLGLVAEGQGVFATSFAKGSQAFTQVIATARQCSLQEAEALKRTTDLLTTPKRLPALCATIDAWFHELEKTVREWLLAHPDLAAAFRPCRLVLAGGGSRQPGLLDYLNAKPGIQARTWPETGLAATASPAELAVAFGIALEAERHGPQPATLLPARIRQHHRRLERLVLANAACLGLLLAAALLLLGGIWQKASLLVEKRGLIRRAEQTLQEARSIAALAAGRDTLFQFLLPILQRQRQTVAALESLQALYAARAGKPFWFVLLADRQSYTDGGTVPGPAAPPSVNSTNLLTPPPPAAPGFVAELCIPADSEAALLTLSELVAALKNRPLFSRVDSLPASQRRNLVDPAVLIPDRHFALALELSEPSWARLESASRVDNSRAATNGFRRFVPPRRDGGMARPAPSEPPPSQ